MTSSRRLSLCVAFDGMRGAFNAQRKQNTLEMQSVLRGS